MSADTVTARAEVIGEDRRRTLVRMARVMFPHQSLPDGPYQRMIDALLVDAAATPRLAGLLVQGTTDLDGLAGGDFTRLDDEAAYTLLEQIQETPFFVAVKTKAINALYGDQEVWEVLGYEGPSFDKGGYRSRGFDDLDWLPEPPV
jgi:hypothetical protein